MSSTVTTGEERGAKRRSAAFTLIELLTVIAIISILAALVTPLAGIATGKAKMARVSAELNGYITAIETYKLEVGSYPPDNGWLSDSKNSVSTNVPQWRTNLAFNPLYYELIGATFSNTAPRSGIFRTANRKEEVLPKDLDENFHRKGIQNSARTVGDIPYKASTIKQDGSREVEPIGSNKDADIELLRVPVPGPFMLKTKPEPGKASVLFNPWFYDASSTNRQNRNGFDLWAEVVIRGRTNIIGNWKE